MLSTLTLKRYIDKCDQILDSANSKEAEILLDEIVATLESHIEGLTARLSSYGYGDVDYLWDIKIIRNKLIVELEGIDNASTPTKPKNKVFISHSGKDANYVKLITELLEDIGLSEDDLFCSSIPEYGIPLGCDIYDYLEKEFKNNNLIVVFALSNNYYNSPACLNEMGAAWMLKNDYVSMLLPGFDYKKINGAINPRKIGIKLDGEIDDLKHRLGELKDMLISLLNMKPITSSKWERNRDGFIKKIQELATTSSDKNDKSEVIMYNSTTLSSDAKILLAYAGTDSSGQIIVLNSLSGTTISTARFNFVGNDGSARNIARWKSVVEELEKFRLIIAANYKRQIFTLTNDGYKLSDKLRENIDTNKSPSNYIL